MSSVNYSDKFYSVLRQFVRNLELNFPNLKKEFADYRKYVKNTKKNKFTKNFYSRLEKFSKEIGDLNYDKLENNKEPIYFFKNIDFRNIFKKSSDDDKKIIMQYLQSLYVILSMIISGEKLMKSLRTTFTSAETEQFTEQNTEQNDNTENFNVLKDMINSLSETLEEQQEKSKNLNNNEEKPKSEKTETDKSPFSFIEDIASEITNEINISDELKNNENVNPMEIIQKMFKGEDNAFSRILAKVNGKITEKMESGELNQENLMKQTQDMMGNLQDTMKDMEKDPEFMKQMGPMANMMKSMNSGKGGMPDMGGMMKMMSGMTGGKGGMPDMGAMMKMMGGMMGKGDDEDDEEFPDLNDLNEKWRKKRNQEFRASMAKQRLQRKLENKRSQNKTNLPVDELD